MYEWVYQGVLPFCGSTALLFATSPPIQIVAVVSPLLALVILWPLEATVLGVGELGLGEHGAAALAAVHPLLPIPDEFATAVGTI